MSHEDILLRLGVAFLFGLIIGGERQARQKFAGLRTHILVCLGSCLITIISIEIANSVPGNQGDPGRMAAQVVSGIGFLGAGAIIKEGVSVIGLTTAASLWLIAAVGLAVGVGSFFSAGIATFLGFFTLLFLNRFEQLSRKRTLSHITLEIEFHTEKPPINELSSNLTRLGFRIEDITVLGTQEHNSLVSITIDNERQKHSLSSLIEEIRKISSVYKIKRND